MIARLKKCSLTGIVILLLFVATSWMQQRDAESEKVAECIPADEGEVAVQTIDNGIIRCEKHPRLVYGMAQIPTLTCPLRGACK